jgi:hypothetical protein
LATVSTLKAPFTGAGVGERGAWAWSSNGILAMKHVMSTTRVSFLPNVTEPRAMNKLSDFCDIFFSLVPRATSEPGSSADIRHNIEATLLGIVPEPHCPLKFATDIFSSRRSKF